MKCMKREKLATVEVHHKRLTAGTFNEALTDLAGELGFEYYAYLNLQPVGTSAVSNYSREWLDRYFSKSFNEIRWFESPTPP
jgi:hypothetical protein